MSTKEILTIIALVSLGLCLLCSLAKMAMKKGDKGTKHCDKVCGAFVFLAIVLLAVGQLLGEGTEKYEYAPTPTPTPTPYPYPTPTPIPIATKGGYCAMANDTWPPYIDTLTECCSDSECNKIYGDYDDLKCYQCSNGICGVFQYYSNNAKKNVYVGRPVCRGPPCQNRKCDSDIHTSCWIQTPTGELCTTSV
jgi:hypothetical protein